MKISLRNFHPADTQALIALYHGTVHEINIRDYSREQVNAWAPSETEDPDYWKVRLGESNTIVAEFDGQVAGFGNLKDSEGIDMLYVHKDYQGRGVASALLNDLEKKLKKKGNRQASVESSITARPFFEHRGYRLVSENRKWVRDVELPNFSMLKYFDREPTSEKMEGNKTPTWSHLFINKVIDLLIVIAGITIAFQLNSLKATSDQRSLERFYLESMVNDLDNDILEYGDNIEELITDRRMAYSCLAKIERAESVKDSVGLVALNLMSIKTFEGHNNTYSTILNNNGLSLIQDPDIRNMILEHYRLYAAIKQFESKYSDVIFRFNDYFSLHIDYNHAGTINDNTIVEDIQVKNLLTISAVQLQGGIWRYEESMEKAATLKERIGSYLE
jgi:putative acetyltransferase